MTLGAGAFGASPVVGIWTNQTQYPRMLVL